MMSAEKKKYYRENNIELPKKELRTLTFPEYIQGYSFMPGVWEQKYPWLVGLKYKIIKEVFVPDGRIYRVGERNPSQEDLFSGNYIEYIEIPMGTLTVTIELEGIKDFRSVYFYTNMAED